MRRSHKQGRSDRQPRSSSRHLSEREFQPYFWTLWIWACFFAFWHYQVPLLGEQEHDAVILGFLHGVVLAPITIIGGVGWACSVPSYGNRPLTFLGLIPMLTAVAYYVLWALMMILSFCVAFLQSAFSWL